ncbi:hypothetical protein Tsubulata_024617 [Turnera subulata]|uniref:(S)-ureidoglycine aminohydrolase cupin domain-containing protein n=1 Tax=Turnera subulata TaxID=218843 RepID=A0A9Q0F9Z7_9ROSI|nr:hypothetical protein Tsubulata_024617 [Turnera subulata]
MIKAAGHIIYSQEELLSPPVTALLLYNFSTVSLLCHLTCCCFLLVRVYINLCCMLSEPTKHTQSLHPLNSSPATNQAESDMATTNTKTTITEIYGLKIEKNPPQSKLDELGVTTWETYTGPVCKNPWTFEGRETVYMVEGKVKLHVEGYEDQKPVEIGAGDLIVFPKGTKIIWEALEPVFKYFNLEKEK